ncbi:MAG TPA: helix-turn-helix domain-containing protein [Blastocatellia bacterium]|nr:helix-turn-helix domain-containing protein [Blastocatellia bacterium]
MSVKNNGRLLVCPVETALEMLSGRWKARILWKLHRQTMRYSELRRGLPGITEKMLAQQLRQLEQDNLVTRTVYPGVPPKVEYSLSDFGLTLSPILDSIAEWGVRNRPHIVEVMQHHGTKQ